MELMYKSETIASLQDGKVGGFKVLKLKEGLEEYKIPRELFFNTDEVEMIQFLNWLKRRIFTKERVDYDDLMQGKEYKVLEIVKETKASLATDDYWVRFTSREKFEDTVRGVVEQYFSSKGGADNENE